MNSKSILLVAFGVTLLLSMVVGTCVPANCDDGIVCTVDTCVGGVCSNVVNQSLCDDGVDCTYDLPCDVNGQAEPEKGCVHLPLDSRCNDNNNCTLDICDPVSSGGVKNSCYNPQIDCDDDIPCTVDTCSNGVCKHTALNSACNDSIPCTVDVCNVALGRCTNIPDDALCTSTNLCLILECSPDTAGADSHGCISTEKECDDEIPCTTDSCAAASGDCEYSPHNSDCNDDNSCTTDTCDTSLGKCVNSPDDEACADADACTFDYCDVWIGCQHDEKNCDDDLPCTVDTCNTVNGDCINTPVNSNCDDKYDCTVDVCDQDLGRCTNVPSDHLCAEYSDNNACVDAQCNPLSAGTGSGCIYPNIDCDDDIQCTLDQCGPFWEGCYFVPQDEACNDDIGCTVDVCDTSLGKCTNTPDDARCDDENSCTIDVCSCSNGCDHIQVQCRDTIECTMDYCDESDGHCHNDPDDSLCDDEVGCTVDTCDKDIGRCTNLPEDSLCDDGIECTLDICDQAAQECIHLPQDYLCNDQVSCTTDVCSTEYGCVYTARDSLCDDAIYCTYDVCDVSADCQYYPKDAWCDDGIDCTDDFCQADEGGCVNVPHDYYCDDEVACTVDTCSTEYDCEHFPDDTRCTDGIGCTFDFCDIYAGECKNWPVDDWCDDGFACSTDYCTFDEAGSDEGGCVNDYSACPWFNLPEANDLCLNCMSVSSRINQRTYKDGTGAVLFQTRRVPYKSNNSTDPIGLRTNIFITPTGQVVVGAEDQQNGPKLHQQDGMVVNGNFRLIPSSDLPNCNDINRGLFAVQEVRTECGLEQWCTYDALFVCVKHQDFEWQQVV